MWFINTRVTKIIHTSGILLWLPKIRGGGVLIRRVFSSKLRYVKELEDMLVKGQSRPDDREYSFSQDHR